MKGFIPTRTRVTSTPNWRGRSSPYSSTTTARGRRSPAGGTYFFADYASGAAWALRYEDGEVVEQRSVTRELGTSSGQITSFGQDARGEVYLLRRGDPDTPRTGLLQRIDAAE